MSWITYAAGRKEWAGTHDDHLRDHPDAIRVQVGRMELAFPAGTSQAVIDRKVKAIEQAPKVHARREAKRFKLEPLPKPLKRPSVAMLADTATIQSDHSVEGRAYMAKGRPILVMPEEVRQEAVIALARKRYAAWLKDPKGDPAAKHYEPSKVADALARMTDEQVERLIESNIATGARLEGKFAATLVECWDELARRKEVAA